MQNDRWLGWLGLIIAFVIFQWVRALLRGNAKRADAGMARLNAAAERILKERGASVATPIPNSAPAKRSPQPGGKPRNAAPLAKSSSPAVIRRGGLLSGQEPVIQRRR